jgi:iron complex transport system ATP-binding protein
MIAFRGVSVRYPRATRPALSSVSFDAVPGRVTAIVGPNGSGKSTCIRALLRTVPLTGGDIAIGGTALRTVGQRELARRVAIVTQREELVFPLDVRDYVALGRFPHAGSWGGRAAEDARAMEHAVTRAGISPLLDRSTSELSGGEWQRVRIARALAQAREAIVLDEPTTFLDVAHEMAMFELLTELAREGTTVLAVSHQINLVTRFADHVVLLRDGEVAASGATSSVLRPEVLERVYDWPFASVRDAALDAPILVPLRSRRR